MKRILYSGGTIVTGDRIASAVLDYAAVLARAGSADHLRVPGVGTDERLHVYDIVVGPASQLLAEEMEWPLPEVEDQAYVDDLTQRARRVERGPAAAPGPAD